MSRVRIAQFDSIFQSLKIKSFQWTLSNRSWWSLACIRWKEAHPIKGQCRWLLFRWRVELHSDSLERGKEPRQGTAWVGRTRRCWFDWQRFEHGGPRRKWSRRNIKPGQRWRKSSRYRHNPGHQTCHQRHQPNFRNACCNQRKRPNHCSFSRQRRCHHYDVFRPIGNAPVDCGPSRARFQCVSNSASS